jgi:GPH family glycoside/pentoside/hexuronide:cation symporter
LSATTQPSEYSEKLSFWTKLAYGSGDLGTAIAAGLRAFFLLIFFTDVARLDPAMAGMILLINRIWDAFNDPFIGWLSDRTTSRWGRRRPWIFAGALPFGLTFFLLWVVPPFGPTGLFLYYVLISLVLDTAYTIVNVPYTALTPELTKDYDERTSLNSFRFAFSVGGALVSAVLHPIIVSSAPDPRTGYLISGLVWAVVCTVPCYIVFFAIRERPESMEPHTGDSIPLAEQIRIALANRPYRFVIGLYLASWLALQLVSAVLVYYLTYYMGTPDRIPLTLLAVQGTSFIFLFVWTAISRRYDKRLVYIAGATIWLVVQLGLAFIRPDQDYLVLPLAALAGAGVAVAYLVPWAMLPDVVDLDELETGQRREGVFYGFMVLLQKAGIALAIYFVGRALAAAGYVTPTDAVPVPTQPDSALQAIRFYIGPVPAAILAGSLLLALLYPITRARHRQILASLALRRAGTQPPSAAALAGD